MNATENGSELSIVEQAKLENLEIVIEGGLQAFVEVGRALSEIRDGLLYRATHATFEDYCQDRWSLTSRYAQMTMAAAKVIDRIAEANNCSHLPGNESQARPLTRLPEDQQADAWREAVATAPNGKVTAAHVEKVVATRLPRDIADDEENEPEQPSARQENRWEREAREFLEEFHRQVDRVCDGGIYTTQTLTDLVGSHTQSFIRMCEVSPSVQVHRTFGRKGLVQYTFEKTACVTAHERIKQLAQQIRDDESSGSRAMAAASRILTLLGG